MKKKLLLTISFLLLTKLCFSAPSNSISIPNSFSANTVISSSQMNANFNEGQTKFNVHNHTDITALGTVTTGTWNATVIDVAYGGSGAATFTDGGILLGSGTSAFTALGAATNGQIPIGDGTTDPVLATLTATADETDVTNGAGTITIGIVDPLIVGKGGTGVATLTDGGILLGSGAGAITALGVATNGQIPIGDGTTDPVLATLTATADETDVTNGAGTITIGIVDPLIVGKGGSGAATFTDGGILLGSGTGAFTVLGAATNGQIPIGDGTTDPVLATITAVANETDVTNGAGTITIGIVDPLIVGKGGTGLATSIAKAGSFTGTGTLGGAVAHGLGSTPGFLVYSATSSGGIGDWVHHQNGMGANVNTAGGTVNDTQTQPSPTNFYLPTNGDGNGSGRTYYFYVSITN